MGILGIDPGTLRMGYGVVGEGPNPHADDYGVIALPAKMSLEQRLYHLHIHILNLIAIFKKYVYVWYMSVPCRAVYIEIMAMPRKKVIRKFPGRDTHSQ